MKKKLGMFGSRILGRERAQREREQTKASVTKFGHRVLGARGAKPGTNTPVSPAPLNVPALAVKDIAETLIGAPAYFPAVYNAEWQRPTGPRRGALEVLIEMAPRCLRNAHEIERVVNRCQQFLATGVDEATRREQARTAKQLARLQRQSRTEEEGGAPPVVADEVDDEDDPPVEE